METDENGGNELTQIKMPQKQLEKATNALRNLETDENAPSDKKKPQNRWKQLKMQKQIKMPQPVW